MPANRNTSRSLTTYADQKPKEKREPKEVTFPMEGFVNKYHFVRVGPSVLNAFGWKISGDRLKVELDLKDRALIVRKPSK